MVRKPAILDLYLNSSETRLYIKTRVIIFTSINYHHTTTHILTFYIMDSAGQYARVNTVHDTEHRRGVAADVRGGRLPRP